MLCEPPIEKRNPCAAFWGRRDSDVMAFSMRFSEIIGEDATRRKESVSETYTFLDLYYAIIITFFGKKSKALSSCFL